MKQLLFYLLLLALTSCSKHYYAQTAQLYNRTYIRETAAPVKVNSVQPASYDSATNQYTIYKKHNWQIRKTATWFVR